MESFVEWGYLGLFLSSFLGATIIPLSSEIVLSLLLTQGFDIKIKYYYCNYWKLAWWLKQLLLRKFRKVGFC